ncbi:antibiotic biosynthesis monooxygenase [Streptomyces sp. NPDC048309]|uniref:antibiotic biosynthesis monooxygenase n=1 Tax=unclassified Streptomyces TaxID=2593676 RepID=UPI00340927E1
MFVRSVYVTGDPAKVDTAIRAMNTEGRDLLEERPGYRGADVFVDRELGKLLAVSWWESEESRHNSDEVMRERRSALLEPFAGTVSVHNYEVAVFHGVQHPRAGGGLRVSRLEFDPADTDLLADTFRATVLPRLETLGGLARTSLFVDRERGQGMVGALFADRESLAASRAGQAVARHEGAAKAHVTVTGLEEFEVVHADVRVD